MPLITSLAEIQETLTRLGYDSTLKDRSVAVLVGGLNKPFSAVVTQNQSTNQFQFTCLIATLGQIGDRNLTKFAFAALDANSRIAPFAYALMTQADDPTLKNEKDWPIILTHSIPIGDLSEGELDTAIKSLVAALMDSLNVVEAMRKK